MIEEKSEFQKQLDDLLAKEKIARLSNDNLESIRILKQIAKLCYDLKDYDKLNKIALQLCTKRGQPKKSQIELVQQCMSYIPLIEDLDVKLNLINAIKDVSEKKIYLEVEYARCILLLVKFKENDNEIADAASILQEVQVETYGSMDRREKLEFILYQMKIMIKKLDYTRLIIISKKIEPKNIEDEKIADLKILYYSYLIFYYRYEGQYAQTANCYLKILETLHNNQELQNKLPQFIDFNFNINYSNIFENYVLYLAVTNYTQEKQSLLSQAKEKYLYSLEQYPFLMGIINHFLSTELIPTSIQLYSIEQTEIFSNRYPSGDRRLKTFRKQLIQHNLRIFHLYYESIYLERISQLINIDVNEIEEEICDMIENKVQSFLYIQFYPLPQKQLLKCRIDRVSGVAQFRLRKNENEVIDEWGSSINKVLSMIELTSNYIKREEELYL